MDFFAKRWSIPLRASFSFCLDKSHPYFVSRRPYLITRTKPFAVQVIQYSMNIDTNDIVPFIIYANTKNLDLWAIALKYPPATKKKDRQQWAFHFPYITFVSVNLIPWNYNDNLMLTVDCTQYTFHNNSIPVELIIFFFLKPLKRCTLHRYVH